MANVFTRLVVDLERDAELSAKSPLAALFQQGLNPCFQAKLTSY